MGPPGSGGGAMMRPRPRRTTGPGTGPRTDSVATRKEQIRADLTAAMKARDELTTGTLRMALGAITNAEVAGKEQVELSDDEVLDVLRREIKRRKEAATVYADAGREDRAERERAEAAVLEVYLPAAMDDDALGAIVAEEVATASAAGHEGGRAMGVVINAVKLRVGNAADGSRIAAAVKDAINS